MTATYYPTADEEDASTAEPDAFGDLPVDVGTGEVGGASMESELLATILATQGQVKDALENQQKQLDDLEELLKATPDGPWNWSQLSPDERRKLWKKLYEWVGWLEDRYLRYLSPAKNGIPDLIPDWYRHPIAVELLTALMVAHAAAYRKKASIPSFALVEWHERCLWPTLARMDQLGLFPRLTHTEKWAGPDPREVLHDDGRFATWTEEETHNEPSE